eukprot:3840326-Amphidinium_carterae.1
MPWPAESKTGIVGAVLFEVFCWQRQPSLRVAVSLDPLLNRALELEAVATYGPKMVDKACALKGRRAELRRGLRLLRGSGFVA